MFIVRNWRFQVIRDYEDDIAVGDDDGDIPAHSSDNDFFGDEVEYSLRSLGLSAEEMRDALGGGRQLLPTESVAIEAMAEMMTNLGGMRSRVCKENSSPRSPSPFPQPDKD